MVARAPNQMQIDAAYLQEFDPFRVPVSTFGPVAARVELDPYHDVVVRAREGRRKRAVLLTEETKSSEVLAFMVLSAPGAMSLSARRRWVVASPIQRSETSISVVVNGRAERPTAVTDQAWVLILGEEHAGAELQISSTNRGRSIVRPFRLPKPGQQH